MADWKSEADQIRKLNPRHILFLCVANSARSQMAEGLARKLAPETMKISSAGSRPSYVHPLSIQVLSELNVDMSAQHSKSVETIDPRGIDLVITLCAEEVCPAFLGKAHRVHWSLPDPASEEGDEARLQAFRRIRDELKERLSYLFEGR